MEKTKRLLFLTISLITLLGFTSCDDRDEVEFYLPGTWYTSQEIDYGTHTWGRGTVMTFNENYEGTIGTTTSGDFLTFRWRWINSGYNTMELQFTDGTSAYIEGANAGYSSFSGTWYNSWNEFQNQYNGQSFYMRRDD